MALSWNKKSGYNLKKILKRRNTLSMYSVHHNPHHANSHHTNPHMHQQSQHHLKHTVLQSVEPFVQYG